MYLTYKDKVFYAEDPGDKAQEIFDAGFQVNEDRTALWTKDVQVAKQFMHCADTDALQKIYEFESIWKGTREASRSEDAPDWFFIPCNKNLSYDPYQRAAVFFAATRPCIYIADEMGLGKTIEGIGVVNYIIRFFKKYARVLYICPGHLKYNWQKELGKWLTEEYGIGLAKGDYFPKHSQHVVINYNILSRHAEILREIEWDVIIIDEAQYLCNPRSSRSKAIFGDSANELEPLKAKIKVAMSGTPFRNRHMELFPMLHWLDPIMWPDRILYGIRYCGGYKTKEREKLDKKTGQMKKVGGRWKFPESTNGEELQAKLRSTIMIRRLKKDVQKDLPPKRRQVISLPPGENDLGIIQEELDAYLSYQSKIEDAKKAVASAQSTDDVEAYREAMDKLRGAYSVLFSKIAAYRRKTAIAKIPFIIQHLSDVLASGQKVIFFGHHHEVIEAVARKFPNHALIYGGSAFPKEEPSREAEKFQDPAGPQLLIASISMATGYTATAAEIEVFGELDWVPSVMSQAEDRGHRRGLTHGLLIQILVLENSLDGRLVGKIVDKLEIMDKALDSREGDDMPELMPIHTVVKTEASDNDNLDLDIEENEDED